MAIGEQSLLTGNREITESEEGAVGTRIFLTLWDDRRGVGVPRHNHQWSNADDARIALADTEDLWVHSIARKPYAASSDAGSKKGATHCISTVTYKGWPLDLTMQANWIVEARHTASAAEVGKQLQYATRVPPKTVPQKAVRLVGAIEYMITGEQLLGTIAQAYQEIPAARLLGTVCSERFVMTGLLPVPLAYLGAGYKPEAETLLFASQSVSAPYYRRNAVGNRLLYRKFQRSVIWKGIIDTVGGLTGVVGGWNLLWDSDSADPRWDLTNPRLYRSATWTGLGVFNDWDEPFPSAYLI